MVEAAQLWFVHLEKSHPDLTWNGFKTLCNIRFGPPIHSNTIGDLISLCQTRSVEVYLEKFQALLACTDTILPDHQVAILIVSLTDKLKLDVQLAKPTNLEEAMSLA